MSDIDDFIAAFQLGQTAVEKADFAKAEIEAVLNALANQLRDISNGRLELAIREGTNLSLGILNLSTPVTDSYSILGPSSKDLVKRWIMVRNPKAPSPSWERIAEWVRPYEGYPCVVRFESQERRCFEREGLKRALAEMLQNALVAGKLRSVMEASGSTDAGNASPGA